ncbi:MAG: ABC transporter substrate-binding protein [Deltaproteobacteria bacterium]|nr:ABC transporter substrate-binding protein [Deltaproteobacteria bacterium]
MKNATAAIMGIILLIGIVFSAASADDRIKVGVLLPLTGKLAGYGEIEHKSFLMAVEEINISEKLGGRQIELIVEDTRGVSNAGRRAIEKLIHQDKVVAIAGGLSSSVSWDASKIAQQNKIPFLVNTGAADKITEQGWEYIFRLNPPVSEYPASFDSFIREVAANVKTVAILHMNSLSGLALARKFSKQAEDLNLLITLKQKFEADSTDFKPLLKEVKAKKPDLVYLVARSIDAALLMRQAREINLNPKLFWGHSIGFVQHEFQLNAGEAAEYIWSAGRWTPAAPYTGAREYFDAFAEKYGISPDYHGAQAYSAMYVIADALRRTDELTPVGVRNALAKTDMMTVFGPVKFVSYDKKVQQNRLPTLLVQWINGKLEIVWPKDIATRKYVFPTPKWTDR